MAADHRDVCADALVSARKLVRALKLATQTSKGGPRVRGRFRQTRLRSASLGVAAVASGMTAADIAGAIGTTTERVGKLLAGEVPTDAERRSLARVLPTWEP